MSEIQRYSGLGGGHYPDNNGHLVLFTAHLEECSTQRDEKNREITKLQADNEILRNMNKILKGSVDKRAYYICPIHGKQDSDDCARC
jgi:hypothetical protein